MRAKKTLGQHFLHNTDILNALVKAAEIQPTDTVIEVGPGTGTLTDLLVATGARVIAVEKDDALAPALGEKYREKENITILHEDILKFSPTSHISNETYIIVGNIPYYLTSHLLRVILETWPKPKRIVFMVQREVAQRMTAKPAEMNMLAVLVQYFTEPKIIRVVKRGSFSPPPKVDSAIIALQVKNGVSKSLGTKMLQLAARGFDQPRKMLGNNISQELLEQAGIDPRRRAETLTVDEWLTIASKT